MRHGDGSLLGFSLNFKPGAEINVAFKAFVLRKCREFEILSKSLEPFRGILSGGLYGAYYGTYYGN